MQRKLDANQTVEVGNPWIRFPERPGGSRDLFGNLCGGKAKRRRSDCHYEGHGPHDSQTVDDGAPGASVLASRRYEQKS